MNVNRQNHSAFYAACARTGVQQCYALAGPGILVTWPDQRLSIGSRWAMFLDEGTPRYGHGLIFETVNSACRSNARTPRRRR